jgi:hypothetical protein
MTCKHTMTLHSTPIQAACLKCALIHVDVKSLFNVGKMPQYACFLTTRWFQPIPGLMKKSDHAGSN